MLLNTFERVQNDGEVVQKDIELNPENVNYVNKYPITVSKKNWKIVNF